MRDEERFVTDGFVLTPEMGGWVKATRSVCVECGEDTMTIEILERVEPDPAPATAEREEGEE